MQISEVVAAKEHLHLPDLSDSDVARLRREIEHSGVAVIPSFVDDATLDRLRQMVMGVVRAHDNEYAVLTGKAEIAETVLEQIGAMPKFINLMHRIYEQQGGEPAPAQSLYQVLRCLSGNTGLRQAYFFHYDSYVVTALLPIIIPEEGMTGDLVMKPNRRPVRRSYFANLIDKILVDNKYSQKFFRRQAEAKTSGFKKIKMTPGNLYLFWGYRSLHANEPCDPAMVRATALFHFGDPHADSRLRQFTGRAKVRATLVPSAADPTVAAS
jgi:hypothetical protein